MLPLKENYQRVVNAKSHVFSLTHTIKSGKRLPTRLINKKYVFHLKRSQFVHWLDSEESESCHSFNKHLMSVNYAPSSCLS